MASPEPNPKVNETPGYFQRRAERLVLEGCRHWVVGIITQSTVPWTQAQLLYRGELGDENGARAVVSLARFVAALGPAMPSPLSTFGPGSSLLIPDEMLIMSLLSGLQHSDQRLQHFCLRHLCRVDGMEALAKTARTFSSTLAECGADLKPLPASVFKKTLNLMAITGRNKSACDGLH